MEIMKEKSVEHWKDMENVGKESQLNSEKYGNYGRKVSWIVKWYGKYGRK